MSTYYITTTVTDLTLYRNWLIAQKDIYPDIIKQKCEGFLESDDTECTLVGLTDKLKPIYEGTTSKSVVFIRTQNQRDFLDACPYIVLSDQSDDIYTLDEG